MPLQDGTVDDSRESIGLSSQFLDTLGGSAALPRGNAFCLSESGRAPFFFLFSFLGPSRRKGGEGVKKFAFGRFSERRALARHFRFNELPV